MQEDRKSTCAQFSECLGGNKVGGNFKIQYGQPSALPKRFSQINMREIGSQCDLM